MCRVSIKQINYIYVEYNQANVNTLSIRRMNEKITTYQYMRVNTINDFSHNLSQCLCMEYLLEIFLCIYLFFVSYESFYSTERLFVILIIFHIHTENWNTAIVFVSIALQRQRGDKVIFRQKHSAHNTQQRQQQQQPTTTHWRVSVLQQNPSHAITNQYRSEAPQLSFVLDLKCTVLYSPYIYFFCIVHICCVIVSACN